MKQAAVNTISVKPRKSLAKRVLDHWQLYVLLILPVIYLLVFCYYPMLGSQIAFRKFTARKGIWGSPWVGFANFDKLFNSYYFERILTNTLSISLWSLVTGFPLPILFALMLNCLRTRKFQTFVKNVTYMPHFISTTVMVGIIMQVLNVRTGLISYLWDVLYGAGATPPDLLIDPNAFRPIYILSGHWQTLGWGTVIYTAALTSVSSELHEAAVLDGASRIQRICHIDIPAILPTVSIMLILRFSSIMGVGFDKAYLLQNDLNLATSEVIATYTYKVGLQSSSMDFSYSTAVSLFNSVINLFFLVTCNAISRKVGETSLW